MLPTSPTSLAPFASLGWLAAFGPHLVVFLAAAAATVTGYGFVVLSAPLLALLMPPPQVVPLTLGLGLVLVTVLLVRPAVWRAVDAPAALRFAAAGLVGIPLGAAVLDHLPQDGLRVVLGVAVALSALGAAVAGRAQRRIPAAALPVDGPAAYAAGLVAGILSGCAGLNGPPVALYLAWRGAGKERQRATSAAVVWLLSAATLLYLVLAARVPTGLGSGAALLPALAAGWLAGTAVFRAISVPRFVQVSLAFAAVAGLATAATGLRN